MPDEEVLLFSERGLPLILDRKPVIEGSFIPGSDNMVPSSSGLSVIKHYLMQNRSASEYGTIGLPIQQGVNARSIYYTRRSFLTDLYIIYHSESVLKSMVLHRRNEAFRRGFSNWKRAFVAKCPICQQKFTTGVAECDECKDEDGVPIKTVKPDRRQIEKFDAFSEKANEYNNSLIQILQEAHEDALLVDDAFIWLQKEYTWGFDHVNRSWVLSSELQAVRRMEPELMEYDLDPQNRPRRMHWVCPLDRTHISTLQMNECPYCIMGEGIPSPPMRPALYKYTFAADTRYLTEDEIIHYSVFHPSPTHGYPPILTIYEKALTLIGMDRWLYRYFYERKVPPGMITVNTDDPDSLRANIDRMKNEMASDPTNYVPVIAVNNKTNRGQVNFIRFFHSLQEMEYGPLREQIQHMFGMFYGVTPIWQNQTEGVGGISGQTQQLIVMSRIVETDQNIINQRVIKPILQAFGVTDWIKALQTPEQKTEETQLRFNQEQVSIAQQMVGLGFEIKGFRQENGDFIFDFGDKPVPQQQQNGQMMGGGAIGIPEQETPESEDFGIDVGQLDQAGDEENPDEGISSEKANMNI